MLICPRCERRIETAVPYFWKLVGQPVKCAPCNLWWETEWDYLNSDESAECWVAGPVKIEPGPNMVFRDGISAHNRGLARETCPHGSHPYMTAWLRGWDVAAEAKAERS